MLSSVVVVSVVVVGVVLAVGVVLVVLVSVVVVGVVLVSAAVMSGEAVRFGNVGWSQQLVASKPGPACGAWSNVTTIIPSCL